MGLLFWKGIENAGFRERADGGWDYFPKGVWGRGYRVTAAQRAELQQALRGYYKAMGFVVAAMIVVQAFVRPIAGKLIVALWPSWRSCRGASRCGGGGSEFSRCAAGRRSPEPGGRAADDRRAHLEGAGAVPADRRPDHDARLGPGGLGGLARPRHGNARGRRWARCSRLRTGEALVGRFAVERFLAQGGHAAKVFD
jgi:hypothetical protein